VIRERLERLERSGRRDPGREAVPASMLIDQALSILRIPGSAELGAESGLTADGPL